MPDIRNRQTFEQLIVDELSKVLNDTRKRIIDNIYGDGFVQGDLRRIDPTILADMRREITRTLRDDLERVYVEAAETFASQLQYGVDADELQTRAQEWAGSYAPTLANSITTTTNNSIQRAVQNAPTLPLNRSGLFALLGQLLLGTAGSRLIATAQTEVTNAVSNGERFVSEKLKNDDMLVDLVWFTQLDERVCPVCAPRHGQVQGDGWQNEPPAHPRCRCYVGYRIENNSAVTILFDDEAVQRRLRRARA